MHRAVRQYVMVANPFEILKYAVARNFRNCTEMCMSRTTREQVHDVVVVPFLDLVY